MEKAQRVYFTYFVVPGGLQQLAEADFKAMVVVNHSVANDSVLVEAVSPFPVPAELSTRGTAWQKTSSPVFAPARTLEHRVGQTVEHRVERGRNTGRGKGRARGGAWEGHITNACALLVLSPTHPIPLTCGYAARSSLWPHAFVVPRRCYQDLERYHVLGLKQLQVTVLLSCTFPMFRFMPRRQAPPLGSPRALVLSFTFPCPVLFATPCPTLCSTQNPRPTPCFVACPIPCPMV